MENQTTDPEATKVKVGIGQLTKPTPKWMSNLANGIIFAGLAWSIICGQLTPEVSEETIALITKYVLMSSGLIKLATKFFGLNIPNAE